MCHAAAFLLLPRPVVLRAVLLRGVLFLAPFVFNEPRRSVAVKPCSSHLAFTSAKSSARSLSSSSLRLAAFSTASFLLFHVRHFLPLPFLPAVGVRPVVQLPSFSPFIFSM
jgi:hypothetical protein